MKCYVDEVYRRRDGALVTKVIRVPNKDKYASVGFCGGFKERCRRAVKKIGPLTNSIPYTQSNEPTNSFLGFERK
jgi:hypothetical protein